MSYDPKRILPINRDFDNIACNVSRRLPRHLFYLFCKEKEKEKKIRFNIFLEKIIYIYINCSSYIYLLTYTLRDQADVSINIFLDAFLELDDFLHIVNSIRINKVLEHD